jgi:hypothetical protein
MVMRGQDPTGERELIYSHLEDVASQRGNNERGRGLDNIARQMNYVETHFLSAVAEKYPALVKKVLGRQRWQELMVEQEARMASMDGIAKELLVVAKELSADHERQALRSPFMVVKTLQLVQEGATRHSLENARRIENAGYILKGGTFRFDINMATWETNAEFEWVVDGSRANYTFKGFSFGYSGEGPRGLEEFLTIFHWNPDREKIFSNQFGMEKGTVNLRDFT